MLQSLFPSSVADRDSALVLIRRLVVEYGLGQWRRYALAFLLMGIAAACTAIPAYLVGDLVNLANVEHNFPRVVLVGSAAAFAFAIKGAATYGQSVILSRIANRIIAENQRRLFSKLLTESIEFFTQRHSSEFAARLMSGAAAATQVLNLLISSFGRDLLSLIGLVGVMVLKDPILSAAILLVCPPALVVLRKMVKRTRGIAQTQFTGGTRILETLQETLQGIRIVKAFTLENLLRARFDANVAAVESEANKMARVASRTSPDSTSISAPTSSRCASCSRSSTALRPSLPTTIGRHSCSPKHASRFPMSAFSTGPAIRCSVTCRSSPSRHR